jgi:hypothetical protein
MSRYKATFHAFFRSSACFSNTRNELFLSYPKNYDLQFVLPEPDMVSHLVFLSQCPFFIESECFFSIFLILPTSSENMRKRINKYMLVHQATRKLSG